MQWHRPVTSSSSAALTHKIKTPTITSPKQMNSSSIPFRELLLQQQQHNTKMLADTKNSLDSFSSIASGVPTTSPLTNSEITASAIISSAAVAAAVSEQDRIALATHFQERDRLILQHQQHQLQRKQKQQKQLDDQHEKPFNSSNRIRDFVIGGDGGVVDRVANIASGKTSGKHSSH